MSANLDELCRKAKAEGKIVLYTSLGFVLMTAESLGVASVELLNDKRLR
jgi:hypothetical protein